jgi:hypothetical protein
MLNKKVEFVALQALKQCRAEMVQDFMEHKPEIYTPSYKYENSPVLLKLAKEKYFVTWLSSHWQIFSHIASHFPDEERRAAESIFARVFLELISKWSIVKTTNLTQLNVGLKLIQDMETALHEFIKVGDKTDEARNRLENALEKNRVIFERQIKQLSEEEN